jgi:hypothetical protein
MKLLSIERSIGIFESNPQKLIEEVILHISTDEIKEIVTANFDDEDIYYDYYKLNENQILRLNKYAEHPITIDLDTYFYVMQCLGEYEYNLRK